MIGASVVRHRFDFAYIRFERSLDQLFAVAGDTRAADDGFLRELVIEVRQDLPGTVQRSTLISCIVFIKDIAFPVEKDSLDRCGTSVDAEPYRAFCLGNIGSWRMETSMAFLEFLVIFFRCKKRRERLGIAQIGFLRVLHLRQPAVKIERLVVAGRNSSADSDIQFAVFRNDHILILDIQSLLETFAKDRLERQRTTKECYLAVDRASAGQAGNRLIDDGLENGQCNVFMRDAFIQERLDICLGENAAAGSDRVDFLRLLGHLSKACCIDRKKRCHTVDECARAACACAIHTLIDTISQVRDLLIFAAQLDDDIRIRIERADCLRFRQDFLTERQSHHLCKSHAAASGNGRGDTVTRIILLKFLQKGNRRASDIGHMTLVPSEKQFQVWRQGHDFDRGRTYVDTDMDNRFHGITSWTLPESFCPAPNCGWWERIPYTK